MPLVDPMVENRGILSRDIIQPPTLGPGKYNSDSNPTFLTECL